MSVLFGELFALPVDIVAVSALAVPVMEALRDRGFGPVDVSLVLEVDALDHNIVDGEGDSVGVGGHFRNFGAEEINEKLMVKSVEPIPLIITFNIQI